MTIATVRAAQDRLSGAPSVEMLERTLRHLAKWRAEIIANTVMRRQGDRVHAGPFAGMAYPVRASEGTRVARLLGAYEASLHPVIEAIIAKSPDLVIDIGSAEGYYAVGLARRLGQTRILARDASARAQALCATLATANGVAARVEIGGLFTHADFDLCTRSRAVVICDIEGAEADLLDPARAPGLAHADILVECHPEAAPGITDTLRARFRPTHRITEIARKIDDSCLPGWMDELSDLDRLLALWEWRGGPTPWLWMERI
jgi:hypothetical protein